MKTATGAHVVVRKGQTIEELYEDEGGDVLDGAMQ